MSNQTFQKPEFRREIRLGLVVYGGISLAIYMNGICREFYNAVRGRGVYKLIKALTDSDIVVDIVSGTSAGGINGVLLSYALTNSTAYEVVDFAEFAGIWRESGDILKLLRQPTSSNQAVESVLNGEGYYQQQLTQAFEKAQSNKTVAPEGEWLSQFRELDLFVTGTDVLGRVYQVFDDTGSVIEIKDHRTVFQLKHRQGRKEPFNPNIDSSPLNQIANPVHQSLAKLCRITSCFPVAFPVVNVSLKGDNIIDQKLVEWGKLENRDLPTIPPNGGYQLYFVDGGVLDNRPFSYTIKEMYYRTANRPVDRKLFYIDPSPDRFVENANFQKMLKPNTLQVIQESLVGIPMYESIGNDLELIKAYNQKVSRYKSLLADADITNYFTTENIQSIDIKETIYLRSRLISLRDRVLPLVLRMDQDIKIDSDKQAILEKTANLLADQITEEQEKKRREEIRYHFAQEIRNLDIEYALRKHFYFLQTLCTRLEDNLNPGEYRKVQSLSANITRQIKLLEVIRQALDLGLSHPQVSKSFYQLLGQDISQNQRRRQFYEHLLGLHRFLLDIGGLSDFSAPDQSYFEDSPANIFQTLPAKARAPQYTVWLSQKRVSSILAQLKQKISRFSQPNYLEENIWNHPHVQQGNSENEARVTILQNIELASEALIEVSNLQDSHDILLEFQRFQELDQVLYPFAYITELTGTEQIKTIRISPDDAQMGLGKSKTLQDKLAGDTLYAFGGFFKKSWRSNDILWGRLDGLNRIVEALVNCESVKNFPDFLKRQARENNCDESPEEFAKFQKKYLEFLVQESLPHTQLREREKILEYLEQLSNPDQFNEEQLKEFLHEFLFDLVLEAHREIIETDLQNVLEDEIVEQVNWNQQRVKQKNRRNRRTAKLDLEEKPQYQPVPGYFDRSVTALAAGRLAQEAIADLSGGEKEDFFRRKYHVGQETVLDSIPTIILANISSRFGLVLRNIVLTTLGDRAQLLRRSLIYNVLDKSLQLFYWWLQLIGPSAVITPDIGKQRPILLFIQIVLLVIAITGVAITVTKSATWLAIAFIATLLFWLLGKLWGNS